VRAREVCLDACSWRFRFVRRLKLKRRRPVAMGSAAPDLAQAAFWFFKGGRTVQAGNLLGNGGVLGRVL
jgi:hypothetical protein